MFSVKAARNLRTTPGGKKHRKTLRKFFSLGVRAKLRAVAAGSRHARRRAEEDARRPAPAPDRPLLERLPGSFKAHKASKARKR